MAPYFFDPNLDENQDKTSNVQISGASPTTDLTPSGVGGTQQPGQTRQSTGSGFQNLDKYLQNNDASGFSNQVQGKVQGSIDTAKQSMTDAGNQFTQQVHSANQVPTQDQINSAVADPTKADAKAYNKWETQSYQGPNSLSDSSDLYNKYWSGTQKANTEAQQLGNEPGRFTLLDSYFGRPDYSFGDKSLDNLLLQQAPGAGAGTQHLQDQATQLNTQGLTGQSDLQNTAAVQKGAVENAGQAARAAVGVDANGQILTGTGQGAIGSLQDQINSELASGNSSRSSDSNSILKALSSNGNVHLSPDQLSALGISDGEQYFDIDPTKYFTQNGDLTRDQSATPEERAKLDALYQLAGEPDSFLGQPSNAPAGYTFDKSGFQNAVHNAGDSYTTGLPALQKALTDAQNNYNGLLSASQSQSQASGPMITVYNPDGTYKQVPQNSVSHDGSGVFDGNQKSLDYLQQQVQAAQDALNQWNATYLPNKKINAPNVVPGFRGSALAHR